MLWKFLCTGGLLILPAMIQTVAKPPEVTVELHTFIAHCDVDDWGRTTGLSCVVTNRTSRAVTVQKDYDGENNLLVAENGHFPIGLKPVGKKAAKPSIELAPGASETLFTLSMHEILQLGDFEEPGKWSWGWVYGIPRPTPPPSPAHHRAGWAWKAFPEKRSRCAPTCS